MSRRSRASNPRSWALASRVIVTRTPILGASRLVIEPGSVLLMTAVGHYRRCLADENRGPKFAFANASRSKGRRVAFRPRAGIQPNAAKWYGALVNAWARRIDLRLGECLTSVRTGHRRRLRLLRRCYFRSGGAGRGLRCVCCHVRLRDGVAITQRVIAASAPSPESLSIPPQ
jgi:hypothetical protein